MSSVQSSVTRNQLEGKRPLPEGWVWTTLEECVDILDNRRVPINGDEREQRIAGKEQSELYPYYGATGLVGWIDDFIFDEEIVLLGEDGAPFLETTKNKAYIVRGKCWVNNHAHVLRAKDGVTTNLFLMHYLNILDYHNYVSGTTRLKLNQGRMREFPIILPPLPEQERIVARLEELLSDLEAGVAALERVRAGVKRYKASVLKAACEGRLLVGTRRDASLREGGLPEEWRWAIVGDLAESIQYGYTESATEEPIGPKFLRITDIQDGRVNWETVPYCKISGKEIEKYLLKPGDIVFARTGATTGKSYLITESPHAVFASYLIRLRLSVALDVKYLSFFLDSPMYWSQIMTVRKGSAQPGVNATILATLKVPLPPLEEQRRIVAEVERRLESARAVEAAVEAGLKRAGRLRQAVLRSGFEGRL